MARSRTTFQPRNTLAVRHGAGGHNGHETALVRASLPAAVQEVNDALASALPYLEPPDGMLVEQLARLVVRIRAIDVFYDRLGGSMVDSRGRPRTSWTMYLALLREFRATAAALGIGPASRASLLGDVAVARRQSTVEKAQADLRAAHAADLAQAVEGGS